MKRPISLTATKLSILGPSGAESRCRVPGPRFALREGNDADTLLALRVRQAC